MGDTNAMQQIMVQYQKKYNVIEELYRLTEELARTLSYNDNISTQLILGMRQEEIWKADECSVAISVLEESMSMEDQIKFQDMLHDRRQPETFEQEKIYELYKKIQLTLEKLIEIDKRANMKIAGKDSFYQTKK